MFYRLGRRPRERNSKYQAKNDNIRFNFILLKILFFQISLSDKTSSKNTLFLWYGQNENFEISQKVQKFASFGDSKFLQKLFKFSYRQLKIVEFYEIKRGKNFNALSLFWFFFKFLWSIYLGRTLFVSFSLLILYAR